MTMRASEERIKAVRAILDMAKADGCECWIIEENCIGECWGLSGRRAVVGYSEYYNCTSAETGRYLAYYRAEAATV